VTEHKLRLKVEVVELPLVERFTIARESWDSATNVFVTVSYGEIIGRGECEPADRWGESIESVVDQIESVDLGALESPFDLERLTEFLPAGSARSAIDIALHDVAAQLAGVPLAHFLGLRSRDLPPTSVTIPIAGMDEMVARAERLKDHPVLKLKVGFEGDVEVLQAIRSIYGGAIRVDANEGWEPDDAIERLRELAALEIEFCEQPVHADDEDGLRRVAAASPIPVFADESACTATDVARLAGQVDGVNLKLRKTGGVRELVKAAAVARAHNMKVMIGCNLESGIACTAGAHLASLVDFADLDGPLLLKKDPYPGVTYDHGYLRLPDRPGLGVMEAPE
jgi:L-Ala-D/L-Glu epimerase / N-acetyl-D-glutamate racemase